MSILTTSAARSRSYVRGRNAHDHVMASPLPQTQSPGTQSQPDGEPDGNVVPPTPYVYEQRYDISLGYDESRRVVIR
jgi:hypothetical protein